MYEYHFINNRNSSGPSAEPGGTPYFIDLFSE